MEIVNGKDWNATAPCRKGQGLRQESPVLLRTDGIVSNQYDEKIKQPIEHITEI